MLKLLDTKAGATFHEEMSAITMAVKKDSIELFYKINLYTRLLQ